MFATRYDDVFVVPMASRTTRISDRWQNWTVDDLEFSEIGRFPRQSSVWVVFFALACFWGVVAFLILIAV